MAFTSYDTLKGWRILRVGGDWGHNRQGHDCRIRSGQHMRGSAPRERDSDDDVGVSQDISFHIQYSLNLYEENEW